MSEEGKTTIIIKKIKKGGHGGAHGGAWKVAYADFVTAMMAFFMVMWLMGYDEETKASIQAYFQGKPSSSFNSNGTYKGGDASLRNDGSQGRFEEKTLENPHYTPPVYAEEQAVLRDLSDYYDGSAFSRDTEAEAVKFDIAQRIIFAVGSLEIPSDVNTHKALNRLAEVFKQHDGSVIIEGFSDETQDWPMAFGRAMAVRRYLISREVSASKLIPMAGFSAPTNGRVGTINEKDQSTVRFVLKRVRQ